jgi:hypothetical protein
MEMEKNDGLVIFVTLTLAAFLVAALFSTCDAYAAEKQSKGLCRTPTPVYFEALGYDFQERQIRNAIAVANLKIGYHALIYRGRRAMGYGPNQ